MKKYYFILLLFVFSFLLFNCSGNKNESGEGEFFSIDNSNLGMEVDDKDMGIVFSPPKNWTLMPSSISKKIEARGVTDKFEYVPIYVFFDSQTGGFLSAGKIISNDSSLTASATFNYYKGMISNKYKNNNLSMGTYNKENVAFTQFNFKKETLVSFKILFNNVRKDIIQLDYTVPEKNLEPVLEKIKSSIGSIKLSD